MKFFLSVLLLLSLNSNSFAGCSEDFNSGMQSYGFASTYFQKGLDNYERAVTLSRQGSSDFMKICNLLVDSVTGFNVATDSYTNCGNSFDRAMRSCSFEDAQLAEANKKVCVGNIDIAAGNHSILRDLLAKSCFKRSSSLEGTKLETKRFFIYE